VLTFNGVDNAGEYLVTPVEVEELARRLIEGDGSRSSATMNGIARRATDETAALKWDVDPRDLSRTGWALVHAEDEDPQVLEALKPLVEWRAKKAGPLCRTIAWHKGESKGDFYERHGTAPAQPVEPKRLPYYLLLIGSPSRIPFDFQQEVDLEHAVGRIDFDSPTEYAAYAASVIRAESEALPERSAFFFGPSNPGDGPTSISAEFLVQHLSEHLAPRLRIRSCLGEEATKSAFQEGLRERPSLLFSASHGLAMTSGDPRQTAQQGALVCQDWGGPGTPVLPAHYLAASDIDAECDLTGMIAFLFACFGGGTPEHDAFAFDNAAPPRIAPSPFVARLPKRMLERGALAVIAHVERAYGYSFLWRNEPHRGAFEQTLEQIAAGYPVGAAMEGFNMRWPILGVDYEKLRFEARAGRNVDRRDLVAAWIQKNDAQFYTVLGDPAAMLQQKV
jgi:hypothetical protein